MPRVFKYGIKENNQKQTRRADNVKFGTVQPLHNMHSKNSLFWTIFSFVVSLEAIPTERSVHPE